MAKFAGLRNPVTLDFEGSNIAYCVDAFCISMGALVGVSPVTAYIESATGISGTHLHSSSVFWICKFLFLFNVIRGRQDRYYGHDCRRHVLHFGLLCAYFRFYSFVGDGWSAGHRRVYDDSQVSWLALCSYDGC